MLIQAMRAKTALLDDSNIFEGCPFLGVVLPQPFHSELPLSLRGLGAGLR